MAGKPLAPSTDRNSYRTGLSAFESKYHSHLERRKFEGIMVGTLAAPFAAGAAIDAGAIAAGGWLFNTMLPEASLETVQ